MRYFFRSRPSASWVSWLSNSRTRSKMGTVKNQVSGLEHFATDGLHQMAFADTRRTDQEHIASLSDATGEDAGVLGRMLAISGRLAQEQGSPDGYRTIINTGRIGRQEVMHLHMHVLGGPTPLGRMLPRD